MKYIPWDWNIFWNACMWLFFFFGRCYYAGLHRGVPWHHQGLKIEGGSSGWLHHAHQSTPGRRGCACKVLLRFTLIHSLILRSHATQWTKIHTNIYTYTHIEKRKWTFFTDQEPRNSVVTGKHDEVTENGFPFSASGSPNLTELTVTRYALVFARDRRSISRIHAEHVSTVRFWGEFAIRLIC